MKEKRAMVKIATGFKLRLTIKPSYFQLLSIRAPKWQSAFRKTRLFAGQTENSLAEKIFSALILTGCRDVQHSLGHEIQRIPFQCQN